MGCLADSHFARERKVMYLRKRWVAKLAEWLFGSSVAAACLAPIVANASIRAGELECSGASMCLCLDDTTGLQCSNPSGGQRHMYHTCTAIIGAGGAMEGEYLTCATGCHSACLGYQGRNCSSGFDQNCYY
jgi:hypothetical protein